MKAEKKRILIVHNEYKLPGGEDTAFANEKALLENAGYRVFTYVKNNQEIDRYNIFRKILLPFRSVYSRRTYREIRRLIRRHSIDLVHVHNTLTVISPSVYYAALSEHVPVVQTVHNFRLLCPNAMLLRNGLVCQECISKGLRQSVKHACYHDSRLQSFFAAMILRYHRNRKIYSRLTYICLTEFNKEMLLKLSLRGKPLLKSSQIYVKPNFSSDPGEPIPYAERQPYFLFASRMERYKGIYTLLEAWSSYEHAADNNDFPNRKRLILCGFDPEENAVRKWISDHKLQHVEFLGQLSHTAVIDKMRSALAVCMPTQCYEGFPLTIAESYACGTPVIGSNIGNVGSLIQDGVTGFTHAPTDTAALAKFFLTWDAASPEIQALSANARRIYDERYSAAQNLTALADIYKNVLEKKTD